MLLEILVANLVTNFQDLVAKVKNLVALAPVLGTILRPGAYSILFSKPIIKSFLSYTIQFLWLLLACVAAVSFPFPNTREREENC